MNLIKGLYLVCFFPLSLWSQSNPLSVFEPLMNDVWVAQEDWKQGSSFRQEARFQYELDSTIIIVHSNGYTDTTQTQFGPRNHGIRQYDVKSNRIKFWEFDVFGGLTQGEVKVEGKNIYYQYEYGEHQLTDAWIYENDTTYTFKVGIFNTGQWGQVFLQTQFKAVRKHPVKSLPEFQVLLKGNWTSNAWDGVLNENWSIGKDGHVHQTAQYLENGKLLYEANNKIEWVNGELILFTVIKNSNPKIFKATSWDETSITFENSEYKNPSVVIYNFDSPRKFNRTIKGVENGKPSEYTFHFTKVID